MGMFGKDKEFGLDITSAFALETPFVLWGAAIQSETIPTEYGDARKTRLIVQRVTRRDDGSFTPEGGRFEVTSLHSAIADKAADAEPDDFPCYCDIREVKSKKFGKALVLQWLGDASDDLSDLPGGRMNAVTGETSGEVAADVAPKGRRAS